MNRFTVLLIFLFVVIQTTLFAQDEAIKTTPLNISGFADVYFQSNFNGLASGLTSFTPDNNSISLGMAKFGISKEVGKVSFIADLGFGPRADAANGYSGTSFAQVQQLYIAYAPSDKITFTAGNFGTHVGYEVIDANANFHYSTSYMFSYGPFFHTGLKADVALTDEVGLMVGIFDDTDNKFDIVAGKNYGAQLSYSAENVGDIYLNYLGGPDGIDSVGFNQIDLTASFPLSDQFILGVNATTKSISDDRTNTNANWYGAALYLGYEINEKVTVGVRGEYFDDADGAIFGLSDLNFIDVTASANITIDALTIIPEFRVGLASKDIFTNTDGDFLDNSHTFILAAVYAF